MTASEQHAEYAAAHTPTLTDLIAEAVANADKPCRKALAANPGKGCTVMGYDHCLCLASARAATAVVADWLRAEADRIEEGAR